MRVNNKAMKKFLCLALFLFCIIALNIVSLDIISVTREHGRLNKVEAYSKQKPEDIESELCTPFYIFDGLAKTDVKIVGKTCYATMSKNELVKMLYKLDAKMVSINNSSKKIVNFYSPRLNTVEAIKSKSKLINMQICVEGEKVQIGIPSLCGFI